MPYKKTIGDTSCTSEAEWFNRMAATDEGAARRIKGITNLLVIPYPMQQYYHCKLVCIFLNGLFLLLYNLFFLQSQYLVYDSDNLLLYIGFEHRIILNSKVQLLIYYNIDRISELF